MHHFYTLLAMDLANERALEAQRERANRRLVAEAGRPNWIRRRLTDAVRGVRSLFDDTLPTDRRTQPRLPASHGH
jgi:hypothetical protein